jgi:hypothetical protein
MLHLPVTSADVSVSCDRGNDAMRIIKSEHPDMGTYLFERCTTDGAGRDAGSSLHDDVATALKEIDWVENFSIHAADGDDSVVGADVIFDEQWPDIKTSNPDQVSEVFHRLGLRTIANQALASRQLSADDPLSAESSGAIDLEATDLFEFGE